MNDILSRFTLRTPGDVLRAIAPLCADPTRRDSVPVMELSTVGGFTFIGTLLALDEPKDALMLYAPETPGRSAPDVIYLRLTDIVAVVVRNADAIAPILSDGAVARAPGEKAPTRLELRRSTERSNKDSPVEVDADWETLPTGDDATLNARDLLDAVRRAIDRSSRDPTGREAWAGIRRVTLVHAGGAHVGAAHSKTQIHLTADLGRALPRELDSTVEETLNSIL